MSIVRYYFPIPPVTTSGPMILICRRNQFLSLSTVFRRILLFTWLPPPIEWIEERLSMFNELLELNIGESAIVLRKLLGPMKLEAQHPDLGKPY